MALAGEAAEGEQQELARDRQRRAVEGDGDEDHDVSVGEDQTHQRVEDAHGAMEEQDRYQTDRPLKPRDFERTGHPGRSTGQKLIAGGG